MSKVIRRSPIVKGWSSLDEVVVRHPDESTWRRTVEHHGVASAVLPYDEERKTCILVSMPRPAVLLTGEEAHLLELPAGMVDDEETHETAARRETLEEAGLELGELELVVRLWTMPGLSTERVAIFLAPYATDDRITAGGGVEAENEQIAVHELSLNLLGRLAVSGALEDGKTLIAAQALMLRRPELFT